LGKITSGKYDWAWYDPHPMHGDNADQTAGLHLLNRVGEVEDIAEMVYAVAKSNFITGAIINVDGGIGAGRNLS